ncbi:SHOCT domain-containing protein [uncultured Piscinibacter sp.]|uniref:SHOCT domain-containing protein n=1 Tax=uncultured Piscinibacter sp. TaxID=1131835 RepID=UPI0026171C8D|nr:SHOCT domain-containing protein [uncultured Piscinibacter sp.]
MMGWTDGYGWMGFGWIFMLLFWGAIIVGVVALIRWSATRSSGEQDAPRRTPLDILQERYVRGEITREEYEQMRKDISQ